jgi:hypothetical protein
MLRSGSSLLFILKHHSVLRDALGATPSFPAMKKKKSRPEEIGTLKFIAYPEEE